MSNAFVMPMSPVDSKPLYNAGSSVSDVFMLAARQGGATVAEIKRALNSDVAIYPVTRHADSRGRRGLKWDLTINGKPGTFNMGLPDSTRVCIVNVRKSESFVNSTHPRSTPGNTAALISARSAASSDAPATKPSVTKPDAPIVVKSANKPTPKSSATVTKRGKK